MEEIELTYARKETLRSYWEGKSLTELTDFIVAHYHARAASLVPEIVEEIDAIRKEAPEDVRDVLIPLQHLRQMLTEDLARHTSEEEEKLFPYIRALESGTVAADTLHSFARIHDEHDQIIDTLVRLKVQSTLCRLPESPCKHCRPLYDRLAVLLVDLREHAFLEDEILFLDALEMEKARNATRTRLTKGANHENA